MYEPSKVVIEKNKRFSECCLWPLQREFFDRQGIDAWVNQVPFYVTSNPFIAHCYAQMVIYFIRDWVNKHPEAKKHPFYIMELGTGSGKFSFYALKKILQLQRDLHMDDVKICYIMSDFTKNNLVYWEKHPALIPYLEQGVLDFAVYNMEGDEPITLHKQKLTLSKGSLQNPLCVFANYIFDTISHDVFSVNHGKIQEVLVNLTTDKSNVRDGKPIDWEKMSVDFHTNEISGAYYKDPVWNTMLEEYKNTFKNTNFLLPVGGLNAIKKLRELANDKLFLISSDKGYSELSSLDNLGYPSLAFHGSFSMMVNFHAIARYFELSGGDAVLQTERKGIKTVVFCSGFKLSDMPETSRSVQQCVEEFSPSEYFFMHRRMSETYQDAHIDHIAAHLALTSWDPYIFQKLNSRICSLADSADESTIDFLANHMPKIMENYYYMPKGDNTTFEIAVFFHMIKRYESAVKYYKMAEQYTDEKFGLYYNLALCLYHTGNFKEALDVFRKAQAIDSHSKETNEWIEYIKSSHEDLA